MTWRSTPGKLKSNQYLQSAGAFPIWREVLLILTGVYALIEWKLGGHNETSANVLVLFFPFFPAIGAATIAKSGQLDLLLGAGKARSAITRQAMLRALGVPFILGMILSANTGTPHPMETVARASAVMLFTGGLGFLAGLWYPRYLLGGLWLASRIGFVLSPPGFRFVEFARATSLGGAAPPRAATFLATLCFPEVLLMPGIVIQYSILPALCGLLALVTAWKVFERLDLPGKRLV